jgi:hypothetical protein
MKNHMARIKRHPLAGPPRDKNCWGTEDDESEENTDPSEIDGIEY